MGSPLEVLANYNPTGFALANQQRQAQLAQTSQQTQALQLENVLRQRQLKDADALTKAYQGVDFNADPIEQQRQIIGGMIQNGASGPAVLQHQIDLAGYRRTLASAKKEDLENEGTINQRVSDTLATVQNTKAEDLPDAWASAAPRLTALTGRQFDPNTVPDAAAIATERGFVTHRQALIEEAQKIQATKTAAQQEQEAAVKTQGTAAANLEAAAQRTREEAARTDPGNVSLQLAAMSSEQRAQLGVKQQEAELQIKRLNEAMQRHEQLYKLESDRNARQAEQFQLNNADVTNSQSPVFGATPRAAMASRQQIMKADTDYNNALASARTLHDFITQIRTGGPAAKAAARLLPTEGSFVLSTANGSHRINRQEVQQITGTGDLYDRIVGKVKGAVTGVNMTDDVLNSLEALYSGIAGQASQKHAQAYQSVDQSYGTHWAAKLAQPVSGGGGALTPTHRFNPATGKIEAIP